MPNAVLEMLEGQVDFPESHDGDDVRWDGVVDHLLEARNWIDNWDGMGAIKPSTATIDTGLVLANAFRGEGIAPPEDFGPDCNGEVEFRWTVGDQRLVVFIDAEGKYECYHWRSGDRKGRETQLQVFRASTMKSESEPISPDEVFASIDLEGLLQIGDPIEIKPRAFYPRNDESSGISTFRDECVHVSTEILKALPNIENRSKYLIAGILNRDLYSLLLTVKSDPIESVPGHCLVPELNAQSWKLDKAKWLPIIDTLGGMGLTTDPSHPNLIDVNYPQNGSIRKTTVLHQ